MEQFLVLTTIKDKILVDRTCGILEGAGIPVILEHVELFEAGESASGFRVLVPATDVVQAKTLLKTSNKQNQQQSIFLH